MRRWSTPILLLLLLPSLASGQSLAEAARKEKERRKRVQESGVEARVITEEDLKETSGTLANDPKAPAATTPSSAPRKKEGQSPTGSALERRERQEEQWRQRAAQARARIEKARKAHESLSSLFLVGGEYYVDEKGKKLIRSLAHLRQLIAQAETELEAAEKNLEKLEETARRNNIPPGWLR